ncbi:MAG: hypothetical protein V1811_02310, partial [Candidatus Micrarchaeota archaeon]
MDLLSLAGVGAYYAFVLLGSVSFGYILLRLTYPDIRVGSREQKLGFSGLAGAGVVLAAVAVDYLLSPTAFLAASGLFPIIAFLFLLAGFFGLKTIMAVFSPKFLVVGVPASQQVQEPDLKTSGISSEVVEPPMPQVVVQNGLRQPVVVSSKARAEEVRKQLVDQQVKKGELDVSRDSKAELEELKKAGEADFDVMVRDLKIAPAILIPDSPVEGDSRHRLYLRRPKSESRKQIVEEDFSLLADASTSKSRGSQRGAVEKLGQQSPKTEEDFGLLVQDVYSQLKSQKTDEGVKAKILVQEPPKPEVRRGKPVEKPPEPTLSMNDLFGEAAGPTPKQQAEGEAKPVEDANPLFAQLNQISSPQKPSDVSFVKMPAEEISGCPRCHSKNSRVVFCPYCGAGMCANCTPLVKPVEGGFDYTCPKCSET